MICLLPLRFVEGGKLAAWSRTAWAVVFGLASVGCRASFRPRPTREPVPA